jgi:hypothetical protein
MSEFTELLEQIDAPAGRFGHRQHIQLAWLAVRRHGTPDAVIRVSGWIRHATDYEQRPQKYNATMTRAWTRIVGHHIDADPSVADFDVFAARNPELLDKRLLSRHYTSATLASAAARAGWVEPDLVAFPPAG